MPLEAASAVRPFDDAVVEAAISCRLVELFVAKRDVNLPKRLVGCEAD